MADDSVLQIWNSGKGIHGKLAGAKETMRQQFSACLLEQTGGSHESVEGQVPQTNRLYIRLVDWIEVFGKGMERKSTFRTDTQWHEATTLTKLKPGEKCYKSYVEIRKFLELT